MISESGVVGFIEKFLIHEQPFFIHEHTFLIHEQTFLIHEQPFFIHEQPFFIHEHTFLIHEQPFFIHEQPFFIHEQTICFNELVCQLKMSFRQLKKFVCQLKKSFRLVKMFVFQSVGAFVRKNNEFNDNITFICPNIPNFVIIFGNLQYRKYFCVWDIKLLILLMFLLYLLNG